LNLLDIKSEEINLNSQEQIRKSKNENNKKNNYLELNLNMVKSPI
jgi:hypothetical protein